MIYQVKKNKNKITGISLALGDGGGLTFLTKPTQWGWVCREKNSQNSGRDGKNCGHLVQPVQLFESTKAFLSFFLKSPFFRKKTGSTKSR
jgi:hypothetical protein